MSESRAETGVVLEDPGTSRYARNKEALKT